MNSQDFITLSFLKRQPNLITRWRYIPKKDIIQIMMDETYIIEITKLDPEMYFHIRLDPELSDTNQRLDGYHLSVLPPAFYRELTDIMKAIKNGKTSND